MVRSLRSFAFLLLAACILAACQSSARTQLQQHKLGSSSELVELEVFLVDIDSGAYEQALLLEEQQLEQLLPKTKFLRVIPLESVTDAPSDATTYVCRVDAQHMPEPGPAPGLTPDLDAAMRIQAVWLPAGGWNATDSQGRSLVHVVAYRVQPAGAGSKKGAKTFELQLKRPSEAVELRLFLHNEGEGTIEVSRVAVIEATPAAPKLAAPEAPAG